MDASTTRKTCDTWTGDTWRELTRGRHLVILIRRVLSSELLRWLEGQLDRVELYVRYELRWYEMCHQMMSGWRCGDHHDIGRSHSLV